MFDAGWGPDSLEISVADAGCAGPCLAPKAQRQPRQCPTQPLWPGSPV